MTIDNRVPHCPDCGAKMHVHSRKSWSGRNRVTRYQCPGCGRTTINPVWRDKENTEDKEK